MRPSAAELLWAVPLDGEWVAVLTCVTMPVWGWRHMGRVCCFGGEAADPSTVGAGGRLRALSPSGRQTPSGKPKSVVFFWGVFDGGLAVGVWGLLGLSSRLGGCVGVAPDRGVLTAGGCGCV